MSSGIPFKHLFNTINLSGKIMDSNYTKLLELRSKIQKDFEDNFNAFFSKYTKDEYDSLMYKVFNNLKSIIDNSNSLFSKNKNYNKKKVPLIKNYQKIKIKSDKDSGVTIASIKLEDLANELRLDFGPCSRGFKEIRELEDALWSTIYECIDYTVDEFKVKVKCSSRDEWNELKGEQIAREKLSLKIYKLKLAAIKSLLRKIYLTTTPLLVAYTDTLDKINIVEAKRKEYISDTIKTKDK